MENIVKCAFVIVGLFHIYNFISNITVFHIHIRHDFLINTLLDAPISLKETRLSRRERCNSRIFLNVCASTIKKHEYIF